MNCRKAIIGLFIIAITSTACGSNASRTLSNVSEDPTYGYTQENPVMVGGGPDYGPSREKWFFDHLVGPDGNAVEYARKGSCCSFESDSWHGLGGALDIYEVSHPGFEAPSLLYVNMYECITPQAPRGFGLLEGSGDFEGTIYFASLSGMFIEEVGNDIYSLDGETNCLESLGIDTPDFYLFSFSPGETRVAYSVASETTSGLYTFDLEIGGALRVSPIDTWDEMPDWSPGGDHIAFARYDDSNVEIYHMNLESGDTIQLTDTPYIDLEPAWSPDGERIAFTSSRSGDADIYIMETDGSNIQNFTHHPSLDMSPAWSPDGKNIAFVSDRNGSINLYTMNSDGGDVTLVSSPRGDVLYPDWSPDGDSIAFCLENDEGVQIYKVNTDGSELEQLTTAASFSCYPEWR